MTSPSSSWLSTFDTYELPVSTTIGINHPLKVRTNRMHMTFEISSSGREGKVHVTNDPLFNARMTRNTVDVGRMKEGESVMFTRGDREWDFVMNLKKEKRGRMTQVVLR